MYLLIQLNCYRYRRHRFNIDAISSCACWINCIDDNIVDIDTISSKYVDIVTLSTISSQCAGIDIDETLLIVGSTVLLSIFSMSIFSISIRYRQNLCRYRIDIDDIVTVCWYRYRRNLVDIVTLSTISSQCAGIDIDETLLIVGSTVLLSIFSMSIFSISIRYRQNLCRYRIDIDDIVTVCWYRYRRNLVDIVAISTISFS